ncbi:hypothetical protein E3A20_12670 [Planctomyces bekefii]|uniref:Uncharacterized protein n=1 Tax=Planctomyces bekefii TaxID=1653850 RepID=A0A5C6M9I6_9PLAN|nr:hypothetical protein E3A20_12670 [Planctomyces bekefii]
MINGSVAKELATWSAFIEDFAESGRVPRLDVRITGGGTIVALQHIAGSG